MTAIWVPSIRSVTRLAGQFEPDVDLCTRQACQAAGIDHPVDFDGCASSGRQR